MIHYICKYTPIEVLRAFDEPCEVLDIMSQNFDLSDNVAHPNLCGFGKSIIQCVMNGEVQELVLVNCCDTIRRSYDVILNSGKCDFVFLMDLPHQTNECSKKVFIKEIKRLIKSYSEYSGKNFNLDLFFNSFDDTKEDNTEYVGIIGARVSKALEDIITQKFSTAVKNFTCTQNRKIDKRLIQNGGFEDALYIYAAEILRQIPCQRMNDVTARKSLFNDPKMHGIIYHSVKFCDFYGCEYAQIKKNLSLPILKLESDYSYQSSGQMLTRLEAFSETLSGMNSLGENKKLLNKEKFYVAGIDSGSTSTDVVILDNKKNIVSTAIVSTGAGASNGAAKSLQVALSNAGLSINDIERTVTTGYGRANIEQGDRTITEISCHAKGAFHLNSKVRTIIDIGGQDSKVIKIDDNGNVINFVMNDKCAAGTGRFLEMMARTLGMELSDLSKTGVEYKEDITISSMCTVFAESEVVSLVAQNKPISDIVHGLNNSVAAKTSALINRLGLEGEFIMTGGVAKNNGVVKAIEKKLGIKLFVCDKSQLCGALGAALFALE